MKRKNNAVSVVVRRTFRFNVSPDKSISEIRTLVNDTLVDLNELKLIKNPLLAKELGIIGESFSISIPSRGIGWERKTIRYKLKGRSAPQLSKPA